MRQLVQQIRTGITEVIDVPVPAATPGTLLVQTAASLISAGTERMLVEFSEKSLLEKARSRPDLVRQVLDKAQREGILAAADAVHSRLDQVMALGYSCSGTVIEVGPGVADFKTGDRVACGGGYAVHAEVVGVPQNLAVKLPESVGFEAAAFTTLGAIALEGIRLAGVGLGEITAVIGLGLLGQLTVQMLKAAGCTVVGLDIQPARARLASSMGADATTSDPRQFSLLCQQMSAGHGVDAVLITADTPSNRPVALAGDVARKRGVVVAVGAVGMNIPRRTYYEKELDFRVSSSYGPGRYDPTYEEKGQDYPYAYVRWTEKRNMAAFIGLLAEGRVNVGPLITHRFPIEAAPQAYDLIRGKTAEPFLAVLLTYGEHPDLSRRVHVRERHVAGGVQRAPSLPRVTLGVLGAGNYANATLLPALKGIPGIERVGIASKSGLTARAAASRFGFAYCATGTDEIVNNPNINTVAVLTRHSSHAALVIACLTAGKHVFVEKPLCLTESELEQIISAYKKSQLGADATERAAPPPYLMVGFNRRFAPHITELKRRLLQVPEPLLLHYRVNAGYISPQHWTQDPLEGGGRLIGEGCHFVDTLIHLAGSRVRQVTAYALPDEGRYSQDNLHLVLQFANGSLGCITYAANGDRGFGKEQIEVFGGGLAARLDDFRTLTICQGNNRFGASARLRQDKGHRAEWSAFVAYLTGKGSQPMSFEEIVHSTAVTLAAAQSLRQQRPVDIEQ